jgi:hypothetical protein
VTETNDAEEDDEGVCASMAAVIEPDTTTDRA